MRLDSIKIKDLKSFLESEVFQKMPVLPISKRRGLAHIANPRALPDDVALLLVYLDDKMVGYLGFLPDDIFNGRHQLHVAWMSCIWVDPNTRGKGIAKKMLKKGFEIWKDKLLATEFTAPAKRLYDKMELFDDLVVNQGVRCYLRFNFAKLLPVSRPKLKPFTPLLKVGDFLLNTFNDLRLSFYSKNVKGGFQIENLSSLDEECKTFIQQKNNSEFLKRSNKDLEWMLENPWLGNSPEDKVDAERYDFSVYSRHFKFSILKIKKGNDIQGLLILAERDDALKIPYCWLEQSIETFAVKMIGQYMIRHKLSMLTTYQKALLPFLKNSDSPFYLQRPFDRHYLISKNIAKENIPNEVLIQDGDGDCAFT